MYMFANSSNPALSTTSSWRQRRPDLTLVKSASWSYSASSKFDPAYPSPPMSNSPTTPRRSSLFPEERSTGNLNERAISAPGGQSIQAPQRTSMEGPMLAMPAPVQHQQQRYGQHPGIYQEQRQELQPRPIASNPAYGPQYQGGYSQISQVSATPLLGVQPSIGQMAAGSFQGPISMGGAANPRITRTSRRAKAHVARACQNCKKAHLSCDEGRPCARCVASGKQATCVDVEHKKRGRPRLRDDREQRLEQAAAAAVAAQNAAVASSQSSVGTGPIRGHRRADSLRVLRSQTQSERSSIDASSQMTLPAPDPRSFGGIAGPGSNYGYYQGPPTLEPPRATGPILSAFLNMDLRILKASDGLRALLADGGDLRGRQLSELVVSQNEPALQRLQSDLRAERTSREPSFLPGIFPETQEQNAVQDHSAEEAELLSRGYDDHNDTCTFLLPGGRTEQIRTRVRLARTSTFFATLTLYRVAPQQQLQPPTLAQSAFARRRSVVDTYPSMVPRPSPTHGVFQQQPGPPSPYTSSTPGSPFSTLPAALMTTLPPSSASIPTPYSSAASGGRSDSGYFARMPPNTGMYPPPPPPTGLVRPQQQTDTRSNTARERHRPEPLGSANIQLPPINTSAPTTPITAQFFEPGSATSRRRTPTAEEEEEDNRKRRRLNITEIIDK